MQYLIKKVMAKGERNLGFLIRMGLGDWLLGDWILKGADRKWDSFRNSISSDANAVAEDRLHEETRGLVCHQCLRSFEDDIVFCSNCQCKQYCPTCIATWYPRQRIEDVQNACPVCRGNCNCTLCLHESKILVMDRHEADASARLRQSLYSIHKVLPLLRQIHEEQNLELEMEMMIRGAKMASRDIPRTGLGKDERIYCNNCCTSIIDFHRSFQKCSYDLCLACCRELRGCHLPGGKEAYSFYEQITAQMNNQTALPRKRFSWEHKDVLAEDDRFVRSYSSFIEWRVNDDGSIMPTKKLWGLWKWIAIDEEKFQGLLPEPDS